MKKRNPSYRTGFFGPYALVFTSGPAPPSSLDLSFFEDLGLTGAHTATLYEKELEVATGSVTVSTSKTSTLSLTSTESLPTLIWQIGDGTPSGFLNADKIETVHPSDSRMSSWAPVTCTIGSSSASSLPTAQFIDVNNPTTI
ncbi:hypothetical protein RSAG8_12235, partial [Rhizoctonia solani AG-8 WAC10335]